MTLSDTTRIKGELLNPVFRGASPATAQHIHDMVQSGKHPDQIVDWVERTARAQVRDYFKNPNLRTVLGVDYACDAIGGPPGYTGTSTGTAATTLTDSGATWTTNQWAGFRLVAVNGAVMSVSTIKSNTGTVITHDGWKVIGTGASASTPSATSVYSISARAHAKYIAYSTDTSASSTADTSLASEVSSNGITRTLATYAHTASTSVLTLTASMTATGNVSSVAKIGVFDCLTGGIMTNEVLLTAAGLTVTSLSSGDVTVPSLQLTIS